MAIIARTVNNKNKSVRCDDDGRLLIGGVTISSATVNIVPATSILTTAQALTIASSATTTLVDYTNTTGGLVLLDGYVATGDVDAIYGMSIDGSNTTYLRTSEQDRNIVFFLPTPMRVENNGSVRITVAHYNQSNTSNFYNSLFGHRP